MRHRLFCSIGRRGARSGLSGGWFSFCLGGACIWSGRSGLLCRSDAGFHLALIFTLRLFLFFLFWLVLDAREFLQNLGALDRIASLAAQLRLKEIFQDIVKFRT